MERSTILNGKIHYFYGHFQLQTVSSPEGISLYKLCDGLDGFRWLKKDGYTPWIAILHENLKTGFPIDSPMEKKMA